MFKSRDYLRIWGQCIRQLRPPAFSGVILSLILLLCLKPGLTAEISKLPKAPQRGTPEGSSTAGGTRSQPKIAGVCGQNDREIAYLLDSGIRDYTTAAYPTFWFYIPPEVKNTAELTFTLVESQTQRTVFNKAVKFERETEIIGVALPQTKEYALKENTDYTWNLKINCRQSEETQASNPMLKGWVRRLPMNDNLKNQLKGSSSKYEVYAQNNILYDALSNLIEQRRQKPQDLQLEQDWAEFLADLGKQELAEQHLAIGLSKCKE